MYYLKRSFLLILISLVLAILTACAPAVPAPPSSPQATSAPIQGPVTSVTTESPLPVPSTITPDANATGVSDVDADGLSYSQEVSLGTSPDNPDTDGDGMPDGWEVVHNLDAKINDAATDPDQDCISNWSERQNGTDPQLADPVQVPANLQGQSMAQAQQAITSACLQWGGQTGVIDPSIPKDQVVRSDPAGGQTVSPNTAINLLVSLGHACARQEVTLYPQSSDWDWFNPRNKRGDNEFYGHGPRVNIKVRIYIKDNNQVYENVYMAAQEILDNGNLNDSLAEGDTYTDTPGGGDGYKEYRLPDILLGRVDVPTGWQLNLKSPLYGEITYTDQDIAIDVFPGDNSPLAIANYGPVAQFLVIGDTADDDIGPKGGVDTGVRVILNPLTFEIVETVDCVP